MAEVTSLCVFCGSSTGLNQAHRQAAARLGAILGENDIRLIYGGGRIGLMGVLAESAMAAGGRVTGVITDFLESREVGNREVDEYVVTDSMHARKQRMFELADAFAILPGGLGTLDESFEIITWKQLGLHDKPILLINQDDYWAPFIGLVDSIIAGGFAAAATAGLFRVVDGVEAVLPALAAAPAPETAPHPAQL